MITIGINVNWDTAKRRINIPNDYLTAVMRAGALPLLFPLTDDPALWKAMIDKVDGVIFPGGEDLDPSEYGEAVLPQCGTIVPERDLQELFTYPYLLTTGKPFLAICRGIQLVNVAQGGTLYQDLATQRPGGIDHARYALSVGPVHEIAVQPDTLLQSILGGGRHPVNSRHHQNIKQLGEGLLVNALSEDGLIEGIEFKNGYPGIALQWHPENLAPTQPAMQRLFDWLVREAGSRA
ncbi:MAG: gamma-glutamyl-gamma-aminobutyrate hydrolase family protein [Christensenellales bacterium]